MTKLSVESASPPRLTVQLSAWLRLGRVSNLPTVWSNVLAALVLAGELPGASGISCACLAFSSFYVGGMFLNDAFDAELDAEQRPERPIPAGLVAARSVFFVGFAALVAGTIALSAIASWLGGSALLAGLSGIVLAGLIVFYDAYHKHNPLSPLIMALCRVGVYVGAGLCVSPRLDVGVAAGALGLLGYLVGLTYAAKQEAFNRLEAVWPLAFLAAPIGYAIFAAGGQLEVLAVAGALLAWQWAALNRLRPGPRRSVPDAVSRLIAGIALVDALAIAAVGAVWPCLACFALCGATRVLQRRVPGT